jgi:arylsulfatase
MRSFKHSGAILCLGLLVGAACSEPDVGPHVILISIDTMRASHVGLYGYELETTPHIDRFFAGGTVIENATSPAPCTIPADRQYLSGGFDYVEERTVLAELLREHGYATAAVVSQHQFYRALAVYQRGFEHFDIEDEEEVDVHEGSSRDAREVTDRALTWLDENAHLPKLFLWVHYFDPHDPYEPPSAYRHFDAGSRSQRNGDPRSYQKAAAPGGRLPPFGDAPLGLFDAEDVAHFVNLYNGEIQYADAEIGRVLDRLEKLGLAGRSIIALLADHGEWLGERERWYHCRTVDDKEVRVPFLLRVNGGPLSERARYKGPASTLDLLPTLAGLLGIEIAGADYHGIDLRHPPENRVVRPTGHSGRRMEARFGRRDAGVSLLDSARSRGTLEPNPGPGGAAAGARRAVGSVPGDPKVDQRREDRGGAARDRLHPVKEDRKAGVTYSDQGQGPKTKGALKRAARPGLRGPPPNDSRIQRRSPLH